MNKKYTLQSCINFAALRGAECLSTEYINPRTKMLWQCAQKHRPWVATFGNLIGSKNTKGTWCPYCSNNNFKHTIQDCIEFAVNKSGVCLSIEYKNAHEPLLWQCAVGHQWYAAFDTIKNNDCWCGKCFEHNKCTLQDCNAYAAIKRGKCKSEAYKDSKNKLLWECEFGHSWWATLNAIKNADHWCPYCSNQISKAQKEIYDYLISIYDIQIILNETKLINPFHLDIYIPSLNKAIEYDGEYWHYSEWAICMGSIEKMERKNKICIDKNIDLLRIREGDWLRNNELVFQQIINFIDKNTNRAR